MAQVFSSRSRAAVFSTSSVGGFKVSPTLGLLLRTSVPDLRPILGNPLHRRLQHFLALCMERLRPHNLSKAGSNYLRKLIAISFCMPFRLGAYRCVFRAAPRSRSAQAPLERCPSVVRAEQHAIGTVTACERCWT